MSDGSTLSEPKRPALDLPTAADQPQRRRLAGLFSMVVTLALLAMIVDQFRHMKLAAIAAMVPVSAGFWIAFAAYYLVQPLSELVIYRRLWGLPWSGLGALLRKLVSNELLLGYLGEAQFYAWARRKLAMTATPFGAIKDVTILSALTGNIATLLLLAFAWRLIDRGALGIELHSAFVSLSVVLVTSFAILLWRHQLFSLPRAQLRFIAAAHFGRIFAGLAIAAVMWHLVLPQVPLMLWLVLATLRMLVSRLPLIPNKDVVFAGLAIYLLGRETQVAELMTMMAGLILAAHLAVGLVFGLAGLAEDARGE